MILGLYFYWVFLLIKISTLLLVKLKSVLEKISTSWAAFFFLPPLKNTMQRRVCKVIGHAHFTVCVLALCDTVDNPHFRMLGPETQFTEGVTSGYWNT